MPLEETPCLLGILRHGHRGQGSEKYPAIAAPEHARIADDHYAVVVLAANQASRPLLERQCRFRKLVVTKRVAAAGAEMLDARAHQRIVWRGERQLLDDHQAQRLALHVHALPDARRAEPHAVALGAEFLQQAL